MIRLRSSNWLLLPLGILAVALRFWHLGWGLPDVEEEALPMKKAFEMWGWAEGKLQLDPQTAGWPSLSFYVNLLLQKLSYAVQQARGVFDDPYDYFVAYHLDPSDTVIASRALSAVVSLVVVVIGFRLAQRSAGTIAALTVGALLALSPLLVEQAQLITPDILLTAFAALAVWEIVRAYESGRVRHYALAGVWIGLGAACKYTPVLLAVSLYLTHLSRLRDEGRSLRAAGFDDRRLGWAALISLLAFCVASPYTLASFDVLRRDFSYQALHMSEGHFGHSNRGLGWIYFAREVFPRAMGWPALLLAASGLAMAGWKRGGVWRVYAFSFLPFFVVMGSLSTHFDRYMLPAILPLALGLGAWFDWGKDRPFLRSGAGRAMVAGIVLACLLPVGLRTLEYHRRQGESSTQQLAREWLAERLDPASDTVAMEMYGPALPRDRRFEWRQEPAFQKLSEAQRERLMSQPYYHYQVLPLYSTRASLSKFYYDLRHFLGYDYLITSGAVRRRYEAEPARFPRQNEFYRDLDAYAKRVQTFAADGKARGPEIRIYQLDPAMEQRIQTEKGPMTAGAYREWLSDLHADHFEAFVDGVAAHATVGERYDIASIYYQMLFEVTDDATQRTAFERWAESRLRARDFEEAERLYRQLIEVEPDHAFALGNLAFIADEAGRFEEAEKLYVRCIEADREGTAGTWAERRLATLRARRER